MYASRAQRALLSRPETAPNRMRPPRSAPWRRELQPVLARLLPALDFVACLLAARLASMVYMLLPAGLPGAEIMGNDWERGSLIGAVLAPFVLRGHDRAIAGLLGGLLPKFAVFAALVVGVGIASGMFTGTPVAWISLWLSFALVFFLLSRLTLMRPSRRESVAIVGSGIATEQLLSYLTASRQHDVSVVGIFDDRSDARAEKGLERNGTIADLVELGKHEVIDWILLALPGQAEDRLAGLVHHLKSLDVQVGLCPQGLGSKLTWDNIDLVAGKLPVTLLANRPIKPWGVAVKAMEDYVAGALITLALLPVLVLVALAIRLESPGPILFRQRRHAWNNAEFDVFKFRSMRWEPNAGAAPLQQTARDDPRISRLGHFLRRTSLDELPQLFNVLRGDMSLVGPRPHAVNMRTQERLGQEIIAAYAHRHRVKPGITGWAQVNGSRGATDTTEQLLRRIELDLEYIERWSIWLDLKILMMTSGIVVRGTNAY